MNQKTNKKIIDNRANVNPRVSPLVVGKVINSPIKNKMIKNSLINKGK